MCQKEYFCRKDKITTSKFCSKSCWGRHSKREAERKKLLKWEKESPEDLMKAMQKRLDHLIQKTDNCWSWLGSVKGMKMPYGKVYFRGRHYMAHRFAFEAYIGEIPLNMLVLHTCDNANCVNPGHLYIGNHLQNQHDKRRRGRCKVEKLSIDDVVEIKSLLSSSISCHEIARRFKCSAANICNIKNGKIWKWV